MARFDIALEINRDGLCMAHVLSLPGCAAVGRTRKAALAELPAAIRQHTTMLARHGEKIAPPGTFRFKVVETIRGSGAFHRGDRAALFAADRHPLTPAGRDTLLRHAAHIRARLLALVRDLPASILDWQPPDGGMTIRQILRHIGNAEEWYLSRLVSPRSLPLEWKNDHRLPIFQFLRMERRTVFRLFRKLTADQLSGVVRPKHFTRHPAEQWTARKALRRLLEHEIEHTAHIRQVLEQWRAQLSARIAAERARLLYSLTNLDELTLCRVPIVEAWTGKDLLAHIAAWDALYTRRAQLILNHQQHKIVSVDLEPRNAKLYAERKGWSLNKALAACARERQKFHQTVSNATEEQFHLNRQFDWGRRALRGHAEWRYLHDRRHTRDIVAWRKGSRPAAGITPKALLIAAAHAARADLLASANLVPPAERETRPILPGWTAKDILGHVADWQWLCVKAFEQVRAGHQPDIGFDGNTDRFNQTMLRRRRKQPWPIILDDLELAQRAFVECLQRLSPAQLARPFVSVWQTNDTPHRWARAWLTHDLEHAAEIRAALGAPFPKRLLKFKE